MQAISCKQVFNAGCTKSYRFIRSHKITSLEDNNTPCYSNGSLERAVILTTEEQRLLNIDVYFSPVYGYSDWTRDFEIKENERIFIYTLENGNIISKIPNMLSERFWKKVE